MVIKFRDHLKWNKKKKKKKRRKKKFWYCDILAEILFVTSRRRVGLEGLINEIAAKYPRILNSIAFKVVAELMDACDNIEDAPPRRARRVSMYRSRINHELNSPRSIMFEQCAVEAK